MICCNTVWLVGSLPSWQQICPSSWIRPALLGYQKWLTFARVKDRLYMSIPICTRMFHQCLPFINRSNSQIDNVIGLL